MGIVKVAPYWRASVNLCLYFHTLSVGVLRNSVWGICTLCCSMNIGIRKESCPSVPYIGVITFTCAQWHRAVFWTHRARCVKEYIFEALLFPLLEKIPTQTQRSMKENKQQHRVNRSYRQNKQICNKVWNMTSHGRYGWLHCLADRQALVEVAACNPRRNSQFLIQMLFRG